MKRAGLVVVMMSLAGCLEPGDFSNSTEIYEAVAALDSGTPDGSAGSGGTSGGGSGGTSGGGSGGTSGGGSGGTSGGGSGGTGGGDASMSGECGDVLEELLKPTCATTFCHSATNTGLDLESDDVGMRLIGKAGTGECADFSYIDADNPEESLLYTKLSDPPPCSSQMPLVGEKYTDAEKACVLEYIEQLVADQ